jgi:mycothiol synthase
MNAERDSMKGLPPEYSLRHPTADDLPAIQRLVDACESADCGETRACDWDATASFADPDSAPCDNWWLVEHGEAPAAFARVYLRTPGEALGEVYVAPGHEGHGLSATLFGALEARAGALADAAAAGQSVALLMLCDDKQPSRQAWLLAHGYQRAREGYVMRIDLGRGFAAPSWPPGFDVREMRPHVDDEALWAADNDAYAGTFLYAPPSLVVWRSWVYGRAAFDPGLWAVALCGEEVAGQAMAMPSEDDAGAACIGDMMVREPWRGRGLGLALLLEVFARLHQRGFDDLSVWVDAESATGAVRLYEAAGMHVWRHIGIFKLELART